MAKRYNTILNDVDYSLTIESNGRCKLIFRKMGSDACFELDFNSIREYLIMTEELRSFFQKMIAEEEYEMGLREFYFED